MERIQELISQLKEQYERKEDPTQLLLTTRLLEAELTFMAGQSTVIRGSGSAKIAVMMPSSMKMYAGQHAVVVNGNGILPGGNGSLVAGNGVAANGVAADNGVAAATSNGVTATTNGMAVGDNGMVTTGNGMLNGAHEAETPEMPAGPASKYAPVPASAPAPASAATSAPAPVYDPLKDIPTLVAHQSGSRELNDVIGNNNGSSLNDRLKVDVMDLSAALNDTPVRDLKKAIGVNDRYVFISQLFRGDEVMYERSIKTINGFRILPEAEYWMERELKVKLGWDENRESTRHFYQLVKRRFS